MHTLLKVPHIATLPFQKQKEVKANAVFNIQDSLPGK